MESSSASSLGWVGVDRSAPEVQALRQKLLAKNGLQGLQICSPDEIERATTIFYRDGFVCVRDALTSEQLAFLREGCTREIQRTLAVDTARAGNRGSHRYSFDCSGTGSQLHNPEWTMLVDLPTVTPLVASIFGSRDYHVKGARGDFVLPGAVDYQPLHADVLDRTQITDSGGASKTVFSFKDPRGQLTNRDLPCFYIACNFNTVDFTTLNGPIRQIPGTQHKRGKPPSLEDEPEWMKMSTLCPLPAGSVIIRDVRAWHGGTPNLSEEVRCIPNIEFYAPWYRDVADTKPCMPREVFETLSDHGKHICKQIVAEFGKTLDLGYSVESVRPGSSPFRTHRESPKAKL